MDSVRYGLTRIRAFVKERRNEIKREPERHAEVTVQCHICRDHALVVGRSPARCLFCTTSLPGEWAAVLYVTDALKRPYRTAPEPPTAASPSRLSPRWISAHTVNSTRW